MKSTLAQLHIWLNGSKMTADTSFNGVSTDSRHINSGNLFVALRGDHFDAHDFLMDLPGKNVAAVIAERIPDNYPIPALIVADTRLALGEIAKNWRVGFQIPVIGVSGSNGKTTVKEMIAAILRTAFDDQDCLVTSGNFNNDIGVPLTIFRMNKNHRVAVIELGMSHIGEMAYLSAIAQPTVGLVNNAQREHQEFMQSIQAVAEENGSVIRSLPEKGIAVFPSDDAYSSLWFEYAKNHKVMTFSLTGNAVVSGHYQIKNGKALVSMKYDGHEYVMTLSTSGAHNVKNSLAAATCCHAIGIGWGTIIKGLEAFVPVRGRLEKKTAFNGAVLIDDTYNANPDSVRAAIDVLADISEPCVLILGDMGEIGKEGQRFHAEVGEYAKVCEIDYFFTYGDMARFASEAYGKGSQHFTNLEELNFLLEQMIKPNMTVLVKGSRFMKMERVVDHLINKIDKEGR